MCYMLFHFYEMSLRYEFIEIRTCQWFPEAGRVGNKREVTTDKYGVSFLGWLNVLKLIMLHNFVIASKPTELYNLNGWIHMLIIIP